MSCLLITTDPQERTHVQSLLHELGLECEQREKAADAMEFCQRERPGLVLVEAGDETADLLRLINSATGGGAPPVVILLAANPDVGDVGEGILQGASEVLMKPFDSDLLRFKLQQTGALPLAA